MKRLKLGKAGFAHHIIILLLVVVSISGFGAYRIIKANAANYDSHVTIRVSGNGGHTVYFKTVTHTLGLCNPHFETISTSSSKTCDGSSMGYPEALNVYVSSVPAGYKLTGWTVTSNNTNGSVSCITTNCRISFDYGSATVTANFAPATTEATDSYVTIKTAGNDGNSVAFAASPHELGTCKSSFSTSSSRTCSGFSMGYPEYLNLSVARAPSGYSFKGWSISSQSIQQGSNVYCSTTCRVSFGQGSVTLTANFAADSAPPAQAADSYVTLMTSGNDGHSVAFSTTRHTLGSCNPSSQRIYVTSSVVCSGTSMGYPSYLNLYMAAAPSGYTFLGWSVSSESIQQGSKTTCTNLCKVNFGKGSVTLTAKFGVTSVQKTDSYVTVKTSGNGGHSASFKTTYHELGSCKSSFSVSSSKSCSGTSMGYPSYLYLGVDKAPKGYTFKSWSISSESIQQGAKVSCSKTCKVNFGQGKVTLTANFSKNKTSAPTGSSFEGRDGFGHGSCVAYVLHELRKHVSGFSSVYGNGKDIARNLLSQGFTVNNTAAVHAVVSFPGGSYGSGLGNAYYGHVAIVGQVNSDGSIEVEEANWSVSNGYGRHHVPAHLVDNLTYAHTETKWK